jgi:hypothetical protein
MWKFKKKFLHFYFYCRTGLRDTLDLIRMSELQIGPIVHMSLFISKQINICWPTSCIEGAVCVFNDFSIPALLQLSVLPMPLWKSTFRLPFQDRHVRVGGFLPKIHLPLQRFQNAQHSGIHDKTLWKYGYTGVPTSLRMQVHILQLMKMNVYLTTWRAWNKFYTSF